MRRIIPLACFVFLVVLSGSVSAAIPISDCTIISSPGVYMLNQSISSGGTCIKIESSDVAFDGQGFSITGPGASNFGVYVHSSTTLDNVTVRNVRTTGWEYGIYYNNAENGGIINNIASNWYEGIVLYYSNNNTLINNTVSNNYGDMDEGEGISVFFSNYNTITNNIASNNGAGIHLSFSNYNTITDNTANSNSGVGIGIYSSSINNTIANNIANLNGHSGIYFTSSSDNNAIYNNFFNNTVNYDFSGTIYSNDWNTTKTLSTNIIDGPYFGGNFWANLGGTGFSETCTDGDSDGICDSSYTLASGNVDYLPLTLGSTPSTTTTTTTTTTIPPTTTTTTLLAVVSFDPNPKDFGVYTEPASDTQSFNIINSGNGPFLGAFSSFISGPNASHFTLLGSTYITVPAYSSVTVSVSFIASEPGLYSAVFDLRGEDAPGWAASHKLNLFATVNTTTIDDCIPTGICTTLWDPVCGVDGKTYSNEGCAIAACVEVAYYGACVTTTTTTVPTTTTTTTTTLPPGNGGNVGNIEGNVGNVGKHCGNVGGNGGNVGNFEGNTNTNTNGNYPGNVNGNVDGGSTDTGTNENIIVRLWQWLRGSGR